MRQFSFSSLLALPLAALLIAAAGNGSALAQSAPEPSPPAASPKPADTLDTLFSELKRERDEDKAKRIANRIWAKWRDSGSATVNLLMQWANTAINDQKNTLALDLLDQAIVLKPDYVEGWNRRATLHFMMGNHAKSMADINRVLTLEPRHFGAISGMAAILSASGNDELELKAWEQVLEVYPSNRQAQEKVGELADKLAGTRT